MSPKRPADAITVSSLPLLPDVAATNSSRHVEHAPHILAQHDSAPHGSNVLEHKSFRRDRSARMQPGDPDHGGWLAPSTRRLAPVLVPVSLPMRLTQRTRAQPVNAGPKGAGGDGPPSRGCPFGLRAQYMRPRLGANVGPRGHATVTLLSALSVGRRQDSPYERPRRLASYFKGVPVNLDLRPG